MSNRILHCEMYAVRDVTRPWKVLLVKWYPAGLRVRDQNSSLDLNVPLAGTLAFSIFKDLLYLNPTSTLKFPKLSF